jgi:N-glycosylase/DNA lyase
MIDLQFETVSILIGKIRYHVQSMAMAADALMAWPLADRNSAWRDAVSAYLAAARRPTDVRIEEFRTALIEAAKASDFLTREFGR